MESHFSIYLGSSIAKTSRNVVQSMRERSASSNNDIDLSIEKEFSRPAEGIDSESPPEPGLQDRRRGFLVGAFYLGLVGIPLSLVEI